MPLITELLRRVAQSRRGIYGPDVAMQQVAAWAQPASVRAWRAWAEAYAATEQGDLGDASRWLNAAESLIPQDPKQADPVLQAELDLLWAQVFNRADEPRRALPYAQASWAGWFSLARNALQAMKGHSLPHLLQALIYPEQTELPPQQLFMEWLTDRASPNLHHAARQVFDACRSTHDSAPAMALAEELRAWYRSVTRAGGLPPEQVVPLVALLLRDVANLQDGLGDAQAALDGFVEARAMLQTPGVTPIPGELRQIDFNIGNQQAKLGRHAEAIAAFEQAAKAFQAAGQEEPALRARHGALVSRWAQGDDPASLLAPLEELLRQYERLIRLADDAGHTSETLQNLRIGNRLWASLASRLLGRVVSEDRFLHQVFASREGNVRAHTVRHDAAVGGHVPEVIDQMSLLLARLADEPAGLMVLALESGVNEVLAVTLVAGALPLAECLTVERLEPAAVQAVQELIAQRREANLAIATGAVAATSAPDPAFEAACAALWQTLPPHTRQRLHAATTVVFLPEPGGALDETPLELVHDGQGYLGLRKCIVRTASWLQLARALAPNHVDRAGSGRFALVRGADLPGLGGLSTADDEVAQVVARAREQFTAVQHLVEPTAEDFAEMLAQGPDVLHFTGHSYADEASEHLVLRADAGVGVPELSAARLHPAPLGIFCSCLVGLHRPTRRGLARGIATAMLDAGAPAVVAAMVPLPDQVGHDFALALHFHAASKPIGPAVQAARITLARRFHPATWGCFALFGRHDARLVVPAEPPPPRWPALLMRCLATRGATGKAALNSALAQDASLPQALGARVSEFVAAVAAGQRGAAVPALDDAAVSRLPADARLALLAARNLAQALSSNDEDEALQQLSGALLMQEIADDHYLLVAVVDAGIRRGVLLVQDASTTALVERAHHRLGWLSRSAAGLAAPREAIEALRAQWAQTLTMQVDEFAGVSPEVFEAADAGDRNAMKEMVWNLKTRDASAEALASTQPWTHWLYRLMGADGDAAMSDFCGVVDAAARAGRLQPGQAEALRTLFKRYIGPGEIEPEHVQAALQQFAGQAQEMVAIRLFQLYDRITSQEREVPLAEIEQARAEAHAQGAAGLAAFLQLQQGGRALTAGHAAQARPHAEAALQAFITLSAQDPAYTSRMNLCAAFLYNVAQASGDIRFEAQVLKQHRARIEAYMAEQQ